jgi:hypothetical protein
MQMSALKNRDSVNCLKIFLMRIYRNFQVHTIYISIHLISNAENEITVAETLLNKHFS